MVAHHAGAHTFGTAGASEKLAGAAKLGLDEGINYRDQDFAQVVNERTDGEGVDVNLDAMGAPYWKANLSSLAVKGRLAWLREQEGVFHLEEGNGDIFFRPRWADGR